MYYLIVLLFYLVGISCNDEFFFPPAPLVLLFAFWIWDGNLSAWRKTNRWCVCVCVCMGALPTYIRRITRGRDGFPDATMGSRGSTHSVSRLYLICNGGCLWDFLVYHDVFEG